MESERDVWRSMIPIAVRRTCTRLKRSAFVRQVAMVAGGTAAAQAVAIAGTPIVTRLYGPDAFGLLVQCKA